ncbi:MAG: molybdenum ABC transporter ATP-binding protein [Methylococcaceae bacterium]
MQQDNLASGETVKDALTSAYDRTLKQRRWIKLERLIDFLELGHLLKQPVDRLPSGERDRVLLAKALLKAPKLLLDDLLASLGHFAHPVTPFLKRVQSELKLPVFYASHIFDDIIELSDKILVVEKGRIIRIDRIDSLLWKTGLIQSLGLNQSENKIRVNVCAHDYNTGCTLAKTYGIELVLPLRRELPIGSHAEVAVSANDIALSHDYLSGISIQKIKGRICTLIPSEQRMLVQIDCGNVLLVGITLRACQDMNFQEGDSIYCLVKTHAFSYQLDANTQSFRRLFDYERD